MISCLLEPARTMPLCPGVLMRRQIFMKLTTWRTLNHARISKQHCQTNMMTRPLEDSLLDLAKRDTLSASQNVKMVSS